MTRKAIGITFDDLDLDPRTRGYLERNFCSATDAILDGRWMAYTKSMRPRPDKRMNKWALDLIAVLEKEGFVRPASDFTLTFNINRLYTDVYDDLDIATGFDYFDNEGYENFLSITEDEYRAVTKVLKESLTEDEKEFISFHYGLSRGGLSHTFTNTRNLFGLTERQATTLELSALAKLREQDLLPKIHVGGC